MLVSEISIECSDLLLPCLYKLFNFMFLNIVYPEIWTKGRIVPIPQKGNVDDVNNYRGITLTSVFSSILDTRLRKWAETNNLLPVWVS
jgi:hypothetical protein